MDWDLEALSKKCGYLADITEFVDTAKEHLWEGRFEGASAGLCLIEQQTSTGRETPGTLLAE